MFKTLVGTFFGVLGNQGFHTYRYNLDDTLKRSITEEQAKTIVQGFLKACEDSGISPEEFMAGRQKRASYPAVRYHKDGTSRTIRSAAEEHEDWRAHPNDHEKAKSAGELPVEPDPA